MHQQPSGAEAARRNKYYSRRRGSIAADPVDDDDVRAEISRLTFAEEQLRHELLQAVVSSTEDDYMMSSMNGSAQSLDSQNDANGGAGANDAADDALAGIEVEEERAPTKGRRRAGRRPWYLNVLGRRKKPLSLEDEIKRQREVLRRSLRTIDEGFEDVMECQTETQEQLIQQSMSAINERRQSKSLDEEDLQETDDDEDDEEEQQQLQQQRETDEQKDEKEGEKEEKENHASGDSGDEK